MEIKELGDRDISYPAFPDSVFTTAEFSFGDAGTYTRRDTQDRFGSVRAITTLGNYDSVVGNWFMYWREEQGDRVALHCPAGTTLLIPTSVVRWAFTAVQKGETRYFFQQSFNAAIGRWADHGGLSDNDFKEKASEEERAAYESWRLGRVESVMSTFVRLEDVFV